MAQANFYFNKFQHAGEQNLIADLVTESISIYGMDVGYLAKTIVEYDELYTEDDLAQFNNVSDVVMYVKSADGFEGEGDFLSKFGLEIRDQMTLSVAVRAFENEVQATQNISRPREGDLIFFPLNEKVYQIQFAEHEPTFYQMGALQFYEMRAEKFEYAGERLNTGIQDIDKLEDNKSFDIGLESQWMMEGTTGMEEPIHDQSGERILLMGYAENDLDEVAAAENTFLETKADNFIDFTDKDPFSEGGTY